MHKLSWYPSSMEHFIAVQQVVCGSAGKHHDIHISSHADRKHNIRALLPTLPRGDKRTTVAKAKIILSTKCLLAFPFLFCISALPNMCARMADIVSQEKKKTSYIGTYRKDIHEKFVIPIG